MMFRSFMILSLATAASAGFAEDTCTQADWVPLDNSLSPTTRVRCCATEYGSKGQFGSCDTSSCPNNFNHMKNRNCFNYGAANNNNNKNNGNGANQGSDPCPYADSDHAICDVQFYVDLNGNKNCRDNDKDGHCLGKVKCNTKGVTIPAPVRGKQRHSNGLADYEDPTDTECHGATNGFKAGDDCFYDGVSENWKVCGPGEDTTAVVEETTEFVDGVAVPETTSKSGSTLPANDDVMTTSSPPGTKGDPHFKTHAGEMYDFHGGCDLVLLDNPQFKDGLGMRIHIRTKIETWWSYVKTAVIQIGDETLEVSGGEHNQQWMVLNGKVNEPLEEQAWNQAQLGGQLLRFKQNGIFREAHIHMGNGEKLYIKSYYDFVKVELKAEGSQFFTGSLGLLGRFPDGKRVGRDGQTLIEDANAFGQEWQVTASEPKLFSTYNDPWVVLAEQKCAMPVETAEKRKLRQRRLAEGMPMEAAEKACSHLESAQEQKACIFDVLATQDVNMAAVW